MADWVTLSTCQIPCDLTMVVFTALRSYACELTFDRWLSERRIAPIFLGRSFTLTEESSSNETAWALVPRNHSHISSKPRLALLALAVATF